MVEAGIGTLAGLEINMPIDLPLNSRYLRVDVITHQGQETVAWWPGASWIKARPAQTIVATSGQAGRLDLIANTYLGAPDLWWAILYYNNVTDINWPRAGDVVAIPPFNSVMGT